MTQPISVSYIVAYGYQDKFELTKEEADVLVKAAEAGAKIVKFRDRVFSTSFTWIAPKDETQEYEFSASELALCEKVAEWLSRDIHNLGWDYAAAYKYAKKLSQRVGQEEVLNLFNSCANGTYPSAIKFLSEAKNSSDLPDPVNIPLVEGIL